MRNSLRKKLRILVSLSVATPLIVLAIVTITVSATLNQSNFQNYKIQAARKVGSAVDNIFRETDNASLYLIANSDISSYFSGVHSDDEAQSLLLYRDSLNALIYLSSNSAYIDSIKVMGNDQRMISCGSFNMNISEQEFNRATALAGKAFWGNDTIMIGNEARDMFYQCRLLRNPSALKQHIGVMKIYLDRSAFAREFANSDDLDTSYYLIDDEGNIVFSTEQKSERIQVPSLDLLGSFDRSFFHYSANNRNLLITPYRLTTSGWILYGVSQTHMLYAQTTASTILFIALAVLCFIVCLVLSDILVRRLLQPLVEVVEMMKSLEASGFSVRMQDHTDDEIGELTRQFNLMAERIQTLINQVYVASLRKKEAELCSLQQQINPHVLYNTLDCAYWIAKTEHARQTSELMHILSQFFRLTLKNINEFSTVERELEHLKCYISLQQRIHVPFICNVDVDPCTLSCKTVRLVLQPIVENALQHGICGLEYGCLKIHIYVSESLLIFDVQDNGHGMDIADMNRLMCGVKEGTRGFGIKNVNDRIELAFGRQYGLVFVNPPEGGALTRIVQPYIPNDTTTQEENE